MEEHFEKTHFAQIVALLRAVNVRSSVSWSGMAFGVQIEMEDGRKAVWGNYENWACTIVETDGRISFLNTHIKPNAPAEAVAKVIIHTDYDDTTVGA